jgi:hypothetical protein
MYVTRMSRYIQRSVLSAVSRNRGRSWTILRADTGAQECSSWWGREDIWRWNWERIKAWESNGKLPLRTCPECSVPESYRSPDWALVPAKTGLRAEYYYYYYSTTTTILLLLLLLLLLIIIIITGAQLYFGAIDASSIHPFISDAT